jgi:3-oxoacyl-[acyl-carrier protein] reductase
LPGGSAAASYSVFDRVGRPTDMTDLVAFVASGDGRRITGQTLHATGRSQL